VDETTLSLVVDTDGGTDDAVALWWALTQPGVDVVGVVASAGTVDRAMAAANAGRVLLAAGRADIPVALGAEGPPAGEAPQSMHGPDGLGGCAARWPVADVEPVRESGAELLARLTCLHPGNVDLVTLGPLTTLAAALRIDPGVAARVRTVTVMGGLLGPGGHVVTTGESNVAHNPAAAAQVLAAPWSTVEPPLLVGLDVTRRTLLAAGDLAAAAAGRTTAARFVAEPLRSYARAYAEAGGDPQVEAGASPCHDLLAVMAAVHPGVISEAPHRRLTVAGVPGPAGIPWHVALAADARRFRSAFRSLVGAPDNGA
jgi:inosine-uridine nucleoside N-ribohydrolase